MKNDHASSRRARSGVAGGLGQGRWRGVFAGLGALLALSSPATIGTSWSAGAVVTNWQTNVPNSGNLNTSSPSFGLNDDAYFSNPGSPAGATESHWWGSFAPQALNVGQAVTATGSFTADLNPTAATAAGMGVSLRWGLFNASGSADEFGWSGFWVNNAAATSTTRSKSEAGTGTSFYASGGAPAGVAGPSVGPAVTNSTQSGAYTFGFALTRTATNTYNAHWTMDGGGGAFHEDRQFNFDRGAAGQSVLGQIDRIGFAFIPGANVLDQINFSNVNVVVPEPASLGFIAAAGCGAMLRRRRAAEPRSTP